MTRESDLPSLEWHDVGAAPRVLAERGVVGVRGLIPPELCTRWVLGTYKARALWTQDFEGEQFSLGRAFYTHLEQGKSSAYFADARSSDARVEEHAPGMQAFVRSLASKLALGPVHPRRGWCGPGIHVFPAGAPVAEEGGVVHFDTEGLTEHQVAGRTRAYSIVGMLQPPVSGGGLRVWDLLYDGDRGDGDDAADDDDDDAFDEEELTAASVLAVYGVGDVVAFDSYRLHQIQPFEGERDRISVTVHLAEIDEGHWESWF
jgi:hypothetical protein